VEIKLNIRELAVGTAAVIVGYNRVYGGYIGKLLLKDLTIGKSLVLLDKELPEGQVKIMLQEKIIQLSKPEAEAIFVTVIEQKL
jgi:ferrous iron transport protein A